ncbi:UDPGT domain-containing protein [Cephalotus follicularis]|uniref:UDPGT domain-containing protein n=1 Tax=Cephalotus follicularis TaxID=3775 RepID=A0A1Q3B9J9_CEPFO|nr:UDPGT domain-containing protein [Cephalotus follicularis]
MMHMLAQLHDPIVNWFKNHPSPPVAIISDMFLGWTHDLACKLGIQRIVFSPSGAMALSTMYYLWRYMPIPNDPNDPNATVSLSTMPNSPTYPWWQISPLYRGFVEEGPNMEFVKDGFLGNISSWGLVINSFTDLEGLYLDHLMKELGHERVWAVGPLLPTPDNDSSGLIERGGSSAVSVDDILYWLDTCEELKVVYVCFGSQAVLTNDQMKELALGLETSGVHFIWSIKEPTKGQVEGQYGMFPSGFEERVAGRGLVIKGWAPQVLILRHRAVGAFLTHCGWNSTLEGLVSGVRFLAWPMGADQFVDTALLVDELRVAIRVCEGAKTVPNSHKLAIALAESVSDNGVDERERAMGLRGAALEAIKEGGSSVKALDGLVKRLTELG